MSSRRRTIFSRLCAGSLQTFSKARSGVAAVEFAVIAPFMLLTYMGVVDITRGVIANRKLYVLSRSVSDLVSQRVKSCSPTSQSADEITSCDIATIFAASSAIMQPFDTSGLKLTVSAVDVKKKSDASCCDALVRWSYTKGGTLRACTTPLVQVANNVPAAPTNIPASLITANQTAGLSYTTGATSYVIIADVSYTYAPLFYRAVSWFTPGMRKTTYMVPRASNGTVRLVSPVNAPAGQSGQVCF